MSAKTRTVIAIFLVAAFALAVTPAHAANVTVKFGYSLNKLVPPRLCPVSVPAGSNGIKVLQAAKAKACIVSYKITTYPGLGSFVQCINGICGTCATYWGMFENGKYTSYGVDGFKSNWGDRLTFTYTFFGIDFCP